MTVSWATRFASCRQRWTRAGYLQTAERCVPNRLSAGGWLANERHRTCPWQPDVMTRQSRGSRLVCHARASLCTRHFARREGLPLAMCTYSTTGCASSLQPPYPPSPFIGSLFVAPPHLCALLPPTFAFPCRRSHESHCDVCGGEMVHSRSLLLSLFFWLRNHPLIFHSGPSVLYIDPLPVCGLL